MKIFNAKTTSLISLHVFSVPGFSFPSKRKMSNLFEFSTLHCQGWYLEVEHEVLYYKKKCLEIRVNA